jgi:GR25 family glycosyltransferase involved in LPS biosynthesis
MQLFDYLDSIAIIHLPTRTDRYASLTAELARIGIPIDHPKIRIPNPPMPSDANGFPSRAVYGNFLSHIQNLEIAEAKGEQVSLTLEDDAIFSRRFSRNQAALVSELQQREWDFVFIGHSLKLPTAKTILVPSSVPSTWAHCYAVNGRIRNG